ncbi:Gfo/Idh/MocA family oxidoreductase [Rhodohalobacter mucosus]|uniref:Oxidoreductase n=1 Tax=Rhodohalobacter mucosus TaxID=2079485 RepID=A0A316TSN2_9BACT|nr:Gfo/Idh/MocA family oxidoreductase [Rhodohalobacter mucosus]PWN06651.1 oxidoreductase [Rhodohalobacter mucosus]
MADKKYRVLVVGCGNMGTSHARAYRRLDEFDVAGVVSRGPESRGRLSQELGGVAEFGDFEEALSAVNPDAVCISTYPGTHAEYAIKSLEAGAHVFVEKPIAETVGDAEAVVEAARQTGKKVVVGYILRHHPGWRQFIDRARKLGKPLVMRMNLNQQSSGSEWEVHKNIMEAMSPIVDCGVHYVDVMCQMTGAKPVSVHAIGARLSEEIDPGMYNYGQLQVRFDDGSVGWYESGWGPMISEQAYFIKDVMGPEGSVSIRKNTFDLPRGSSADIGSHTGVPALQLHSSKRDKKGRLVSPEQILDTPEEPDHDELCYLEQKYFLKSIMEDLDLTGHLNEVVHTLKIVLASDESVKTGRAVELS